MTNTRNLKFLRENFYHPSMRFFVQEIPIQKCIRPDFFYLSTDFQNFCCIFCDKLDTQLCKENFHLHLNRCKISAKNHYQSLGNPL